MVDSLYQWHTTGGVQRPDLRQSDWNEVPPRMSGIYYECQEVNTEPSTGNQISGPVCGLSCNGNQVPIKHIWAEAHKIARQETIPAHMLAQLLGKMNATNCVLPPGPLPANGTSQHTGTELPMLWSTSPCYTRVSRGTGMVGQHYTQVEWKNSHTEGYRSGDRFHCIPGGMGCLLFQSDTQGDHGLSGKVLCISIALNYLQQPLQLKPLQSPRLWYLSSWELTTPHSGGLHKQSGRNSLQRTGGSHKRFVDVVPGKEYLHSSSAPTRCTEYNIWQRVQAKATQDRLAIEPRKSTTFMGPYTWTCLHPDCPPSAHSTSAGGQILMSWQQMPFSRTGQLWSVTQILHGIWWVEFSHKCSYNRFSWC